MAQRSKNVVDRMAEVLDARGHLRASYHLVQSPIKGVDKRINLRGDERRDPTSDLSQPAVENADKFTMDIARTDDETDHANHADTNGDTG